VQLLGNEEPILQCSPVELLLQLTPHVEGIHRSTDVDLSREADVASDHPKGFQLVGLSCHRGAVTHSVELVLTMWSSSPLRESFICKLDAKLK
jgi:hypothetical protein